MHEFPLIQEFVEEAETKGLERGREEGERKATIESILALLVPDSILMPCKF